MRVERLTRLEDTVYQMQEFTHDGDDHSFARQATRRQAFSKGAQHRVKGHGGQGWHEQGGAQTGRASARNAGAFMNGGPRDMLTRVETDKGHQLADIANGANIAGCGQQLADSQVTQTWDGAQQVRFALQVGMLLEQLSDGLLG